MNKINCLLYVAIGFVGTCAGSKISHQYFSFKKTTIYNVYIDPSFTFEQRSDIVAACRMWQESDAKPVLNITIGECKESSICVFPVAWDAVGKLCNNPEAGACTFQKDYGGDIYIVGGNVPAMIAHEIGHAMGLDHNDIENTLMYPYLSNVDQKITSVDIQQYNDIPREAKSSN